MPPPAPQPKTFGIFWADHDRPVSYFHQVTGSSLEDNKLILIRTDLEVLVNFDEVRYVLIEDS